MIRFYLGWDQHVKLAALAGLTEMGITCDPVRINVIKTMALPEFLALPDSRSNGWVLLPPELAEKAFALHNQMYKALWADHDPAGCGRQAGLMAMEYERISNARSTTP